jgi:Lipopolysaccharide-assembly
VRTELFPKINRLVALAFLVLPAISGCGYHFASSGDALPASAQTIYVQRFENRTRNTGLNDEFMRYVKDEIALHKRLRVVDDPATADLVLSGDIKLANSVPVNFNSALEPTIYNQSLSVSASLKDTHDNKVIWSTRNVSNSQHAPVVAQTVVTTTPTYLQQNLRAGDIAQMTDIQTAEAMNSAARDTMMQKVAQNLYAEMAEGF